MVVVSGTWVKNVVSFPINGELITTVKMAAKAVLICRPNSHPFQERTLSLDQPVKIGRSVARARAVPNNAIFDCKVLSRNHALLWYENGKFYLQDTKSSNGTFVNNQRLSKGAEESPPREVCSGDIVQFGVDVMENARKVTHGCIVATVKLYLPDGKEAKASPSTSVVTSVGMVPLEDLYQLNIFLQEALQKEHMLEDKLATLQKVVEATRQSSELAWKALIDEDRLLSRVETLETQLLTTSKNFGEDKLREELRKLQDDKHQYQGTAKESLQKLLEEKLEVLLKLQALELSLTNSESECGHLKQLWDQGQHDLQDLAQKFSIQLQKVEDLNLKMEETSEQHKEMVAKLELEKQALQAKLLEQTEQSQELQVQLEALHVDGDLNRQRMTDIETCIESLNEDKDGDMKELLNNTTDHPSEVILDCIPPPMLDNAMEEVEDLQAKLQNCQDDLQTNKALVVELQGSSQSISVELCGAEENRNLALVHLETVRSEEDLTQEKSLTLQERIDGIGQEIDLASAELDTNKCMEGDVLDNSGQVARLKAERLNLQELLAEIRLKKKLIEDQKEIFEQDLIAANLNVKNLTEESNVLKQKLLTAESQVNENVQIAQDLQNKIEQLQTSLGEHATGMGVLQGKLNEQCQRADKFESSRDSLKEQCMESQQTCKQYRNQCEQWQDRFKAMEIAHSEATKMTELKKKQEVQILRDQMKVLEGEVGSLREEQSVRIALAQDLESAKLREQELLRRLDLTRVPRDVTHDALEEELAEIKLNFIDLTSAMERVETNFQAYKAAHPAQPDVLNMKIRVLIAILIFMLGIIIHSYWY